MTKAPIRKDGFFYFVNIELQKNKIFRIMINNTFL